MKLFERISRILNSPELELDGDAYKGKYELNNGKSIKAFILNDRLNEILKDADIEKRTVGDCS